jgi:hypothetical protein
VADIESILEEQLSRRPTAETNYERCPRCGMSWHGLPRLACPGAVELPTTRILLMRRVVELTRQRMRDLSDQRYFGD